MPQQVQMTSSEHCFDSAESVFPWDEQADSVQVVLWEPQVAVPEHRLKVSPEALRRELPWVHFDPQVYRVRGYYPPEDLPSAQDDCLRGLLCG